MYKDARFWKFAAAYPEERDMPFKEEVVKTEDNKAKNDPVGREIWKSNAYGVDRSRNWADRS